MRKIYIYSKLSMGFRAAGFGLDFDVTSFHQKSTELKKNLEKALTENELNFYEVEVSQGFETPEELVKREETVVLISPYLREPLKHIDFSKPAYYLLSEEEYDSRNIDGIIEYLKTLIL